MPTALHQDLEARHNRITRKAAAREREIARNRSVTLTEAANTICAEPARAVLCLANERFELDPRRGSVGDELV